MIKIIKRVKSYLMNNAYSKIMNINTLGTVLRYLKSIPNKDKVSVWLDWDETIVNSSTNIILENETTKELFKYMMDEKIFFAIITGRFYDTACDEHKRNIFEMQVNIKTTIFPVLEQLGIDTKKFLTPEYTQSVYKIFDENGICIGVMYMGILFSHVKGGAIRNFLRQTGLNLPIKIFVDDFEPYLIESTASVPDLITFRRHLPA